MDSFVREAHECKEFIYGDEGVTDPPPFKGFEKCSRINSGIFDRRDEGLTTGHGGEWLPDAWGRDEFLPGGQEWDRSGPQGWDAAKNFYPKGTPVIMFPFKPSDDPEWNMPDSYAKLPKNYDQQTSRQNLSGQVGAQQSAASRYNSPPTYATYAAPAQYVYGNSSGF